MKALLVENSRWFQGVIGQVFTETGMEVICVDDADRCFGYLDTDDFGLIAVSYDVEEACYYDVIKKLKSDKKFKDIPALLLTSDDDVLLRQEGLENGYTDVICKQHISTLYQYVKDHSDRAEIRFKGDVLYIENDLDSAILAGLYLNTVGLDMHHFTTADEALISLDENDYELIISDVALSGKLSGFGVISHVRHLDNDKSNLPILAVSAFNDNARKIELLRHGATDFIEKPIQTAEFIARVTNLVKNKQLIDQVKLSQSQLYQMAMTDQLTGLYNRYSLLDLAPKWISDAYRHNLDLCLLMLDLDNFKTINDNYGHAVGDKVLKEIGDALSEALRDGDIVARFGGEEFIVVLQHCDIESGIRKAEHIRTLLSELNPNEIPVSASIGLASLDHEAGYDFDTLLKQADNAMYEAKKKGRNNVIVYGCFNKNAS